MPSKDRMNSVHPERSRNVSRCGMKLIIPHNEHITNENRADRRARMKIELTGVHGTLLVISFAAIAAFRMLFLVTMHPEIVFRDLADAFYIPKASLEENSSEKGCFRLGEIIPADGFLCMGMNSSRENNP